jgi:glycine cleavage system H protein
MSNIPSNLSYTKTHEWVRLQEDGTVTMGITDHAQDLLGDVVFIDVPPAGRRFKAGEACAVIESVKAAADVYCPLSGEVIETNSGLADNPEQVNKNPYDQGWLLRLRPDDAGEFAKLMDTAAYNAFAAADAH